MARRKPRATIKRDDNEELEARAKAQKQLAPTTPETHESIQRARIAAAHSHGHTVKGAPRVPIEQLAQKTRPGEITLEEQDEASPDSVQPARRPLPSQADALGRYQVLFELAKGGMGTVHVGRLRGAHGFDRLVAIKKLSIDGATDEDVDAFLREARLSAKIDHPNVVKTLELGEQDGVPFIVMELVQGVSLSRLLKRLRKQGSYLDAGLAIWIMAQAATGLHAAHELRDVDGTPVNLVHRDVSPENVLLSFDGRVYVADFGVAKHPDADKQTQSGVVKGKYAYMSPEQSEAFELDRRSDVFSLGIVLHECLTGERLFEGRSVPDTIRRIFSLEPPDPRSVRSDVPDALIPIVMRCLAKERDERYGDASQVVGELRNVLRSSGKIVDDADVAKLLRQVFPDTREHLRERIREAVAIADADERAGTSLSSPALQLTEARRMAISAPPPSSDDDVANPGPGSVTASITTGPPLAPRRFAGAWTLAGAAALIGVGVLVARGLAGDDANPATETTSPAAETHSTATEEPAPLPTVSTITAEPSESATASAAPSTTSMASAAPTEPPPHIASPPPKAQPPTPPPKAQPTAQPKSHKGVPFREL